MIITIFNLHPTPFVCYPVAKLFKWHTEAGQNGVPEINQIGEKETKRYVEAKGEQFD